MKKKRQKRIVLLVIPLLVFSFLYISLGMGVEPEYGVNPHNYTVGVTPGDTQTYIFEHVRVQEKDIETHVMQIAEPFEGINRNISVEPGTKVTLKVEDISETNIVTSWVWNTMNGSILYPDLHYIDLSTLIPMTDYGPRMVMTTNQSLIEEVFEGTTWKYDFLENNELRLIYDYSDVSSNGASEGPSHYEHHELIYDLTTGFLIRFSMRGGGPDYWMELEFSEYESWNPAHFELGVNVGDTNTYVLTKFIWYNHGEQNYYHDLAVEIIKGGKPEYISLYEGEKFSVKVISLDHDGYIELEITYIMKDMSITDDRYYLIDRSTSWAPRFLGPPLLMTVNRTLIQEIAPDNIEITDDILKFWDQYSDPSSGWNSEMKGSWNLTSGWLREFYNINKESNGGVDIVQYEMEIVALDLYEPEPIDFVGVKVGDSLDYKFTEISWKNPSGFMGDLMPIYFVVDGVGTELTAQPGDELTIEVIDISGSQVTTVITLYSSIDGMITTDPQTFDLKYFDTYQGPPHLVSTDKQMIQDQFQPFGDVYFPDSQTVILTLFYTEETGDYEEKMTYDLNTGWLTKYVHSAEYNGDLFEYFVVESEAIEPVVVPIGVTAGDSITYEFKEIFTPDSASFSGASVLSDTYTLSFPVQGVQRDIRVQPGDKMTVKVKSVQGSVVRLEIMIDSTLDGEVTADPFDFDLTFTQGMEGPMFLVPTDEQMIKDLYPGADFTFGTETGTVKFSSTNGKQYDYEITYDLSTGWMTKYQHIATESGETVEKLVAEAVGFISGSTTTTEDGGPQIDLTSVPLFPILFGLLLVGGIFRKKR